MKIIFRDKAETKYFMGKSSARKITTIREISSAFQNITGRGDFNKNCLCGYEHFEKAEIFFRKNNAHL